MQQNRWANLERKFNWAWKIQPRELIPLPETGWFRLVMLEVIALWGLFNHTLLPFPACQNQCPVFQFTLLLF